MRILLLFLIFCISCPALSVAGTDKVGLKITKVGHGIITSSPAGIRCGKTCAFKFDFGSNVTLAATAATGYQFSGWDGACSGLTCALTLDSSTSVVANFSKLASLTIRKVGKGSILNSGTPMSCGTSCNVYLQPGATLSLSAVPATGYYFSSWSGACSGTGLCTVQVDTEQKVKANFAKIASSGRLLKANTPYLNGRYITAGLLAKLNAKKTLALSEQPSTINQLISRAKSLISRVVSMVLEAPVGLAYADPKKLRLCSTVLGNVASGSSVWDVISLTDSSNDIACVTQVQDAGRYIILKPINLQSQEGLPCDLVAIEKATGANTCIYVPVPERAVSGPPKFHLGFENSLNFPGQLSKNGNYFFVSFYTDQNPKNAYVGHLRLDFTGPNPVSLITQLLSGALGNFQGIEEIKFSGKNISIFSELIPSDNGDYIYTWSDQTNKSTNSKGVENALIHDYFYVIVDASEPNPEKQHRILFVRSKNEASNIIAGMDFNSYALNIEESPVGIWWKSLYPETTGMVFDGEILPYPDAFNVNGDRTFFFTVGASYPQTSTNIGPWNQVVRGRISATTGALSFESMGCSNVGNGWGTHRNSSNILLNADRGGLHSYYVTTNPQNNNLVVLQRSMQFNSCTYQDTEVFSMAYGYSQPLWSDLNFETQRGVFLFNFNFSAVPDGNTSYSGFYCSWNNHFQCQFSPSSVALYIDKATGAVKSIPLAPFDDPKYSIDLGLFWANPADRLIVRIKDYNTGKLLYTADLTENGFEGIIEYATPNSLQTDVVKG